METDQKSENRLVGILEKLAIGAISFVVVALWNDVDKLQEKYERLQANTFTTENSRILEDRLTKRIDAVQFATANQIRDLKEETKANFSGLREDVNSKLDLLIKMQTESPSRR